MYQWGIVRMQTLQDLTQADHIVADLLYILNTAGIRLSFSIMSRRVMPEMNSSMMTSRLSSSQLSMILGIPEIG